MPGFYRGTDCRTFFEDKKQERRWNNDNVNWVRQDLRNTYVMYGGAKRSVCGWNAPFVRTANMPYLNSNEPRWHGVSRGEPARQRGKE